MLNSSTIGERIAWGADLYRHFVPDDWIRYPNITAACVAVAGLILAFWGTRLLKTIYILGFMVLGAAVGFRIGSDLKIDTLVGLTFGAGVAALIGYLFYRWWVGVTTGVAAVLLVLVVAWPKVANQERSFQDFQQEVGSGEYVLPQPGAAERQSIWTHFGELGSYLWREQRAFGNRLMFAAGLAWLLGMVMGLLMPRFTTVMGTSVLGVLLVSAGAGVLLYRNWPDAWRRLSTHPDWYLIGMGALLIVSSWHQVRPGRVRVPPAVGTESPASESPPAASGK